MPRNRLFGLRAPLGWVRRNARLCLVLAALLAVNVAVLLYHGDPRHLLRQYAAGAGIRPVSRRALPSASPREGGSPLPVSAAVQVMPLFADAPDAVREPPGWGRDESRMVPDMQQATAVGPPYGFDPLLGLRSPGEVQRVELLQMQHHQSVEHALLAMGIRQADVRQALASLRPLVDFRHFRASDAFKACFDAAGTLVRLEVDQGPLEQTRTCRRGGAWHAERLRIPVGTVVAAISGEVRTTLWDALVHAGESPALVQSLVDIFAYEIDFYSEVHPGDSFGLLVEKRFANGQFMGYGDMPAAEFYTGDRAHRAFLYRSEGTASYFDEAGRSMRKQLLRTPLRYGAVTSRFGVRHHPVLGYTRNHNGTDYGVPVGTPVWSVGDGRVITAGWHGGYGRLVEVSHANGWVSQYAHLSKISVRLGQHVLQKDVVGLVGQTGLATGPHLHYGLKKNGHFVNSLAQKFERARSLTGEELAAYRDQVQLRLEDLRRERLAQKPNTSPKKKG